VVRSAGPGPSWPISWPLATGSPGSTQRRTRSLRLALQVQRLLHPGLDEADRPPLVVGREQRRHQQQRLRLEYGLERHGSPSAVVGWAALLALVGGGDGAGDQGRRHVAVGEDAVVETAQAEGVTQAGLGGGA
jgi:hypothetical protein